jgi:predicted short-subunit dehydrogenase-like oxidoreductase (DUF2520 family)
MSDLLNITLVGSGNIAWHIGHRIIDIGGRIVKIISRGGEKAYALAGDLNCEVQNDFSISNADSDYIIVAINDSHLRDVLLKLNIRDSILLHTSGSLGLDVFPPNVESYGVLYPFQTLTAGIDVNFSLIPLCIEGCDKSTTAKIEKLAGKLSSVVKVLDSQQRRILHLTGVIGNNFTNHFMTLAIELLEKNNMDRELLMPLLEETINKLKKTGAYDAQTGPARRNNMEVINKHMELLNSEPRLKKLYSIVSDSIIAYYSRKLGDGEF